MSLTHPSGAQAWRVNEESHSFTCHPHVYPQMEWAMPAITPQPQSITSKLQMETALMNRNITM